MNRSLFGSASGGMSRPIQPLMPQKLGLPMARGRGRPTSGSGSAMPQIGPAFSRPSGLQMFAEGGSVDMGDVMRNMTLRSMPNRSVPEYLMARMADGGEPPEMDEQFMRMPMRGIADDRRARKFDRFGLQATPRELDYADIRDLPRPEREMAMFDSDRMSGRDRQREALYDMYNAGPLQKVADEESREGWHDMAASTLDPTTLPMLFSGTSAKTLAKLAPRLFRRMPMHLPKRAMAGEFGAWSQSGPNVPDLMGAERPDQRWAMERLPESLRTIGER